MTKTGSCDITGDVTLVKPMTVSYSKVDPTCDGVNNGSIEVSVTGGSGKYNYHWYQRTLQVRRLIRSMVSLSAAVSPRVPTTSLSRILRLATWMATAKPMLPANPLSTRSSSSPLMASMSRRSIRP